MSTGQASPFCLSKPGPATAEPSPVANELLQSDRPRRKEYGVWAQVAVSTVMEPERLLFRKLPYPGIYRCVARYGYRDRVQMDSKFVTKLLDKVCTTTHATSMLHASPVHLSSVTRI